MEGLWLNMDVFVCQVDTQMCVSFLYQLDTAEIPCKEETSTAKIPPQDITIGIFLIND